MFIPSSHLGSILCPELFHAVIANMPTIASLEHFKALMGIAFLAGVALLAIEVYNVHIALLLIQDLA